MKGFSVSEDQAIIFNIQHFSIHDGPGIRTTVFLKGCPLQCRWCANPESQKNEPQLMVRYDLCCGCRKCLAACPEGAVSYSEEGGIVINWNACSHCFRCVEGCTGGALEKIGLTVTVPEIVTEVLKDQVFYKNSKGGVTASGGEPTLQHAFLLSMLSEFKQEGLHVVLDTCGYASEEIDDAIIPLVDLILFDIKHIDSAKHERFTGVGNDLIIANAMRIAGKVRMWLRAPLVLGFNDSEDDIVPIAGLACELEAEKISLPPYHDGGRSKCIQIGMPYRFPEVPFPDKEHVERLLRIIRRSGLSDSAGC